MNARFDKFTERARKVLTLAQEEATRFNHNYIGTEHLLLGLIREGEGVAARVLSNLGVELNDVRERVEFRIGRGDHMIVGEVGLTPRAKKVIELAVDEARRLGHHYIGTEHLLLGLVREGEGIAASVLESLGVTLEKVRTQTIQVLSQSSSQPASQQGSAPTPTTELPTVSPGSDLPFTEGADKVLTLAQEEATRFNHNYIGTEHLLLGLVRAADDVAARVLIGLGVELNRVRSAVEFIIGHGDRMIMGEIGLTPRAKKVIELAKDEARRLGHPHVGTEHLLLGLVREGEGIAAGVLESMGVSLENVRVETFRVLGQGQDPAGPFAHWPLQQAGTADRDRPGQQGQWEYLVLQVGYPDPQAAGVVVRVLGRDDERFGSGATPVHEALQALGAEGWELVAIDRPAQTDFAHYVLKRSTRGDAGTGRT